MGIPNLRAKAMLGGMDLGEVFFGIIHKERLYFKTNEQTQPIYTAKGMKGHEAVSIQWETDAQVLLRGSHRGD